MKTPDILCEIIKQKHQEIAYLKQNQNVMEKTLSLRNTKNKRIFKGFLQGKGLAVIAEIKRKSPGKGVIANIDDPYELARQYISAGANAISVLTDKTFFGGSLKELQDIVLGFGGFSCGILRKDFIVDKIQIIESVLSGADAILLIVAVLQTKTKQFLEIAKIMGIDALVEVRDRAELNIAIDSGAEIIGVNNRNLNTFNIDINNSLELISYIPKNTIKVSESGIDSGFVAKQLKDAGFDAILVGESLMCSSNPSELIRQLKVLP